MLHMSTKHRVGYDKNLGFRTNEDARRAIKIVVNRVESAWLKAKKPDPTPTLQDVVNASWLWMAEMPESVLAAQLDEYIQKIRTVEATAPKSNKATEQSPHDPAIPPTGNRRLRKKLDG